MISATVGVGTTKLFKLNANFEDLRWLAGPLACGLASALMTVTNSVYPPAGATALLAVVDPRVEHLGWYLLPLILLSAALTLMTSLIINNIQRQYPTYWWTPANVGKAAKEEDVEKALATAADMSDSSKLLAIAVVQKEFTGSCSITITAEDVMVPEGIFVAAEERNILEILQGRVRDGFVRRPEPLAQVR